MNAELSFIKAPISIPILSIFASEMFLKVKTKSIKLFNAEKYVHNSKNLCKNFRSLGRSSPFIQTFSIPKRGRFIHFGAHKIPYHILH